jgi:hypothetical protein
MEKILKHKWKILILPIGAFICVALLLVMVSVNVAKCDVNRLNFKYTRGYALGFLDEYQIKSENRTGVIIHRYCSNTYLKFPEDSLKYEKEEKKILSKFSSYAFLYVVENLQTKGLSPDGIDGVDGYIDVLEDGNGKIIVSVRNVEESDISISNIMFRFALWLII